MEAIKARLARVRREVKELLADDQRTYDDWVSLRNDAGACSREVERARLLWFPTGDQLISKMDEEDALKARLG